VVLVDMVGLGCLLRFLMIRRWDGMRSDAI
jgi:hypothetical protein